MSGAVNETTSLSYTIITKYSYEQEREYKHPGAPRKGPHEERERQTLSLERHHLKKTDNSRIQITR